jgi:hypothetical protein
MRLIRNFLVLLLLFISSWNYGQDSLVLPSIKDNFHNFFPGSDYWIPRFLNLYQKGKVNQNFQYDKNQPTEDQLHKLIFDAGILSSHAFKRPYQYTASDSLWTDREQFKLIFFQLLLTIYEHNKKNHLINYDDFLLSLHNFYELNYSIKPKKYKKNILKLEKHIEKRIQLKYQPTLTPLWITNVGNPFVFIDLVAYNEFLITQLPLSEQNYESRIEETLKLIILASNADNKIQPEEKEWFRIYMAGSSLETIQKEEYEELLYKGLASSSMNPIFKSKKLYNNLLFDISAFTCQTNLEISDSETNFLQQVSKKLYLNNEESETLKNTTVAFFKTHRSKINYLQNKNERLILKRKVIDRVLKVWQRNKNKLKQEWYETKEMGRLLDKDVDLTATERKIVSLQLVDCITSIPSFVLFAIPGGSILLPIAIKFIPALLPTSFRDNEIPKSIHE